MPKLPRVARKHGVSYLKRLGVRPMANSAAAVVASPMLFFVCSFGVLKTVSAFGLLLERHVMV